MTTRLPTPTHHLLPKVDPSAPSSGYLFIKGLHRCIGYNLRLGLTDGTIVWNLGELVTTASQRSVFHLLYAGGNSFSKSVENKIINLNKGNYGKEVATSAMWLKLFSHNIQDIFH